jgi:hypothetical protein
MSEPDFPRPSSEQAALFARVRRMMLIAGATSALAIAVVLIAIGYRFSHLDGSANKQVTATLPKGARILSTAVAGDRMVLTLDIGGATEIRTFDVRTFQPLGTLKFATEP